MRWVRDLIRRERYRVDRACRSVIRKAEDATATRSHFIRLSCDWAARREEPGEAEVGAVEHDIPDGVRVMPLCLIELSLVKRPG